MVNQNIQSRMPRAASSSLMAASSTDMIQIFLSSRSTMSPVSSNCFTTCSLLPTWRPSRQIMISSTGHVGRFLILLTGLLNMTALTNYIGFFTILWFTWLETSLFDVRFSSDSVFNRVCKSISFGVMTGFAVCGAIYDTTHIAENVKAFRAMSIILMVSRLSLVAQYAV